MANLRVDKITRTETFETTGSVQFDGPADGGFTATGYMVVSSSSDFAFGTGDFTVELWVYGINWDASTSNNDQVIYYHNEETAGFFIDGGRISYYNASIGRIVNPGLILENNKWYHLAAVRKDGVLTVYVDGDSIGSAGDSDDYGTSAITIGKNNGNDKNQLLGHISNFRILKGKALYTKNFKPPMRELEVTPETVLLACQHKTDASHEKTGKTITVTGNAVANELTPGLLTDVVKSGGNSAITGSVEFANHSSSSTEAISYLSLPTSEDFNYGTGDFTIECWINRGEITNDDTIFGTSVAESSATAFWYFNSSGNLRFREGSNTYNSTDNGIAINSWNHVAVTRESGTLKIFVNGIVKLNQSGVTQTLGSSSQTFQIGRGNNSYADNAYAFKGFISNLRIVKGTALYTANFIPPTRELKKVPGTVLLCCQDSNDPTTEATGKTITPYGSLGNGSLGSELVTSNDIWTMECGGGGCSNWTASNNGSSLAGTTVTSGYIRATYTVPEGDYLVSFRWTGGNFAVQSSAGYLVATDGTDTNFGSSEDGAYSVYMTDTTYVRFTGTSWETAYTVDDISIKRIYKNNGASNFTPQVGNDGSVEFVGPTKINTENYFYLPTGDTESRYLNVATQASSSARGLFGGAYEFGNPAGSRPTSDVIDYVTIPSTGNAIDFGDLTESRGPGGACASSTRGVWMGGDKNASPYRSNTIDYVTISSKGNAIDFGDTILPHGHNGGTLSDSTRGITGGGNNPTVSPNTVNGIEYITIASTGDGRDFGDLTVAKYGLGAVASPTRGVFSAGDLGPAFTNTMDYITIQSMGNAIDFGDGITNTSGVGAASNSIRGLFAQGQQSPYQRIDYITIASTGNAIEFGNLTTSHYSRFKAGAASPTRAVFAGGYDSPNGPGRTDMDYVTIMSTGDATDFGDLTTGRGMAGGCSNGHGGLG